MDGFYDKIRDPKANGAAFFAVCRGKVNGHIYLIPIHDFNQFFFFRLAKVLTLLMLLEGL